MLARDFSQLPIIDNHRRVKGIISWRSIGKALHFERSPASVSECMEFAHEIDHEASLFEAIPRIIEHEYVLVHDANGRITGIVTNADLSLQFYTLSEPFLLLSEIENQLRVILDFRLPLETLVNGKDPRDTTRVVTCASDLSFGEYKRIMEDPTNWDALNLRIDRRHFIEQLEQVRKIRNDVMHFDPARIGDTELASLQKFNRFVHELSPAAPNGNHPRN